MMCGQLKNWLKWPRKPSCEAVLVGPAPPEFAVGEWVAVRLNERNTTRRVGQVALALWHLGSAKYYYFLDNENGELILDEDNIATKRFYAEDFEQVSPPDNFSPTT